MSPQPCVWYHGLEWEPAQQHHRPWQLLLRACSTHPRLFAEPYRAVLRDRAPGLTRTSMHLVWIQSWMGERYAWQKFLDFFSFFFLTLFCGWLFFTGEIFFWGVGGGEGVCLFYCNYPLPSLPQSQSESTVCLMTVPTNLPFEFLYFCLLPSAFCTCLSFQCTV